MAHRQAGQQTIQHLPALLPPSSQQPSHPLRTTRASRRRQDSAPSVFWMLAVTKGMTNGTMASPAVLAHSARQVPAAMLTFHTPSSVSCGKHRGAGGDQNGSTPELAKPSIAP